MQELLTLCKKIAESLVLSIICCMFVVMKRRRRSSAWRKWWNKEFAIILSVWMTLPYKRETLYFPLLENCIAIISLYLFAI